MVGISEVIQTLGAMIIFSMILLTSNRMIQNNTLKEVESEAESIAVELAQSVIEEAQTKPFDANTSNGNIPNQIPQGFSDCGPGGANDLNDFDDYDNTNNDGYNREVDTELGPNSFRVEARVLYVSPPDYRMDQGSTNNYTMFKKMEVTVTSPYLNNNRAITLSYLRRYYKKANN